FRSLKERNPSLRVITLGGYINTDSECWRLINKARTPSACRDPDNVTYFANHPEAQPLYRDIMALTDHFVDRVDLLCRNRDLQTCAVTAGDGTPAFFDAHHLSLEFADMAGRRYAASYPDVLREH
ncbi:MAG: SGNH hydrolase domain-containing protein, partial [Chromatocurvus sp.]